ncbi:MAG: acyl-CoA dehydrogenase [Dehalococcoidia bacterium]|nr:acyl-CoA dehydrogenase [Dehalococcoidia bacterium]MSQ17871.1 acyl-CoA dehydrogenase [Dehalococcoidia bacterium]
MPDLLLNEEEKMLQALVRDFADRELIPRARAVDEGEKFSWENWQGMARLGLTGIGLDSQYGGTPGGYRQIAIAAEEVGRGDAAASVTLIAHLSLGTTTMHRFGNEEQKQRLIPSLAAGTGVAAWALTEPGSGSDAAALQTTATKRRGSYYLNGSKMFITNAEVAESMVVFATLDRSQGYRGISAFVVPKGAPGLIINPMHGKMGMRGSSTCEVVFQDTPVPPENLLGEEGRGFRYAMEILDSSRIIIAAQCVGIGQAALEAAVRYAQRRQTFGKPIAQHQAIQFMLADMAAQVHAARVCTMTAATLKDNGLPFLNEASIAKLIASEMCVQVASQAIQVHGGAGYFKEAGVERIFRDARATTIYEGTSEVQRLVIARQVLAQYPV